MKWPDAKILNLVKKYLLSFCPDFLSGDVKVKQDLMISFQTFPGDGRHAVQSDQNVGTQRDIDIATLSHNCHFIVWND